MEENNISKLQEALFFTIKTHFGQYRKEGLLPYAIHPVEVMKILYNWGVRDEDTLVVALCHDIVEDTDTRIDSITSLFGKEIAEIVYEMTFTGDDKMEYLKSFNRKSVQSLIIKIADRIANVLDFGREKKTESYALKYWNKAFPIVAAFCERDKEIISFYGKETYNNVIRQIYPSILKGDENGLSTSN